jgi:hypothetical protein
MVSNSVSFTLPWRHVGYHQTKGLIMFYGSSLVMDCLYGMKTDTADEYAEKLKAAIEYLGDKYLLATPVEKK